MGSIALTVLTITLGSFFIFVGQFKITSKISPEIHEDMKREFGRVNKVFPFYELTGWRPYAKNYRMAVGIAEVVGGAILVMIPGPPKQLANVILLILMLGAVYTHYILHDKFEKIAPGLVFSLLLVTRLIIYRQVTQREKSSPTKEKIIKSKSDDDEDKTQESDDAESQSENEDKENDDEEEEEDEASSDKKKEKKNK